MAAHTMQHNVIIPEHLSLRDDFKNMIGSINALLNTVNLLMWTLKNKDIMIAD